MAKKKADLEGAALGSLLGPSPSPARLDAAEDADAPDDDGAGYARTSTGYRRGDGETLRRLSLFLTERQRRELKRQAAGADTVTEYVVEALGLNRGTR